MSSKQCCPHGISLTANPPCHFCDHQQYVEWVSPQLERLGREMADNEQLRAALVRIRDKSMSFISKDGIEITKIARAALEDSSVETPVTLGPREPDNSMVICPACTCQFPAISVDDQAERRALREHIAWAWSIIANVSGGDWTKQSQDWQTAASSWERARNPHDGLAASRPETKAPQEVPYLDSVRLEWLFRHISGAEWRRLGITTSAGMNRTLLNDAMVIAESAQKSTVRPLADMLAEHKADPDKTTQIEEARHTINKPAQP
jgi:hypothetical protein